MFNQENGWQVKLSNDGLFKLVVLGKRNVSKILLIYPNAKQKSASIVSNNYLTNEANTILINIICSQTQDNFNKYHIMKYKCYTDVKAFQ